MQSHSVLYLHTLQVGPSRGDAYVAFTIKNQRYTMTKESASLLVRELHSIP